MSIKLIVGLGNPGKEYENTRHNAGALFVSYLCSEYQGTLRPEKKFHGLYGKIIVNSRDIHLLIPTTFMNRSGLSIQAFANYFNLDVTEILVAHDELDIPCGAIKLKSGGGHGGHNGLKDIIKALAGQKEFYRLRVGIDHPGSKEKVTGYVLGKIGQSESALLDDAFDQAKRALHHLAAGELPIAMNKINSYRPSPR
ncbi:MAG: aminoacyl-tRNA hydrolase [Gammaproteobacteria bacterium]|nr:MAG: aminoacyl-tRNA hydrolase [Gammaproteobacteria bacterium]